MGDESKGMNTVRRHWWKLLIVIAAAAAGLTITMRDGRIELHAELDVDEAMGLLSVDGAEDAQEPAESAGEPQGEPSPADDDDSAQD